MRIQNIEKVTYDEAVPVYDVIMATPHNNFLIKTMNSQQYIVSHNC